MKIHAGYFVVTGKDGRVIEKIDWDGTHDIERPAADRLLSVTPKQFEEVQIGWTFKAGYFYPPEGGQ